jgi:hypothetical protein
VLCRSCFQQQQGKPKTVAEIVPEPLPTPELN